MDLVHDTPSHQGFFPILYEVSFKNISRSGDIFQKRKCDALAAAADVDADTND